MKSNKFDSEITVEVLSSVLQSGSISTIKELHLRGSSDFSTDETCALLAQFIDSAEQLGRCYIRKQVGERKIDLELQVASSEEAGVIKITNQDTKEVIMSMPTQRTEEVDIDC